MNRSAGHDEPADGRPVAKTAVVPPDATEPRADPAQAHNGIGTAQSIGAYDPSTQHTDSNEHLVSSALRDALTGLPNRRLMLDLLAHAIADAKRRHTRMALLFLDLDGFKLINNSLGRKMGDEVLKRVAHCLTASVRLIDTVSRRGGDEFLILLSEIHHASDAVAIAGKIIVALAAIDRIGTHPVRVTTTIGVSLFPDDGADAETLIDRADAAMYLAKRRGLGHYFFSSVVLDNGHLMLSPNAPAPEEESASAASLKELQDLQHADLRDANEQLIISSINAQEGKEAAEYAQRKQAEFLAVLAHELCSPLTPIRLAVSLMEHTPKEELPQMQALIEREVVHISRLVSDLLDVARVTTGNMRLERRVVDIRKIVEAAVDACRPAMDSRHQRFTIELPTGPLNVRGDTVRLTQILRNLLDNANKYTPVEGHIALSIEVVGESIQITVTDNGMGITASAMPFIFEPFKQDTRAIGFNGVGLGIGLKVVHELVEAHGGTIVATSDGEGLGSKFVVSLPLHHKSSGDNESAVASPD